MTDTLNNVGRVCNWKGYGRHFVIRCTVNGRHDVYGLTDTTDGSNVLAHLADLTEMY